MLKIPLVEYLLEHCQTQNNAVSTAMINSSRPTVAPTAPNTPEIDLSFEPRVLSSPSPDPVICVPVAVVGSVASSVDSRKCVTQ